MKLSTKLILMSVTIAMGGIVVYRVTRPRGPIRGPKFLAGDEGVKHIFAQNTVSSELLQIVHTEVDTDALVDTPVSLSDRAQRQVYDIAHRIWTETDFADSVSARRVSDSEAKAELVRRILQNVAPQTSWHVPRGDMDDGDARAKVWDSVAWLVELMGASVEEETRSAEEKNRGAA